MKGVPCGSQAFIDGGWHVTGTAVSDSNEVSGASNGGLGHLKERSCTSQKLHSFPPHLGLTIPQSMGSRLLSGRPGSLGHPAHGEALKGCVPWEPIHSCLAQGALARNQGNGQLLRTAGEEAHYLGV